MLFRIHPIEPLHAFGPVETNEDVLIARLRLCPDSEPEVDVLSSSYAETFQRLLDDKELGVDPKAWEKRLGSHCLALVEATE